MKSHTAYIGLGSNQGDRVKNLTTAITLLNGTGVITVEAKSPYYETKAVLPDGAKPQPDFQNGAVKVKTTLTPLELLGELINIEGTLGRPHPREKSMPRTIDLDILMYDDLVIDTPVLKIPHPELEKRLFVLVPLCDICPDVVHPKLKSSIGELKERLEGALR